MNHMCDEDGLYLLIGMLEMRAVTANSTNIGRASAILHINIDREAAAIRMGCCALL